MKLVTYRNGKQENAGIMIENEIVPIEAVNRHYALDFPVTSQALLEDEHVFELEAWLKSTGHDSLKENIPEVIDEQEATFAPLYRQPSKIWGIGPNYVDHATDLHETAPNTEPASFMKPTTTIIGHGDEIKLPLQSEQTTGEAELGIVIGKRCKDVSEADAMSVIAGFTTIIDMTAEDILAKNPRYLTRSKSFDTFFSFGPALLTLAEVENVHDLEVSTIINNQCHRKNRVANMTFTPEMLISFHSKVMTLEPGDIISTGTPGAVQLKHGDTIRCDINGSPSLENPVRDLKT